MRSVAVDSSVLSTVVVAGFEGVPPTRTRGAIVPSPPLSISPALHLGTTLRPNSEHDVMGGVAGSGAVEVHRRGVRYP